MNIIIITYCTVHMFKVRLGKFLHVIPDETCMSVMPLIRPHIFMWRHHTFMMIYVKPPVGCDVIHLMPEIPLNRFHEPLLWYQHLMMTYIHIRWGDTSVMGSHIPPSGPIYHFLGLIRTCLGLITHLSDLIPTQPGMIDFSWRRIYPHQGFNYLWWGLIHSW